jgi:multiple sugar transport system substrate-binding protein
MRDMATGRRPGPPMTRRRFLQTCAAAAAVAPAAGCALRSSESANQINVLTVGDPFFYALETLLPEFEKEYGVKVSMEGLDYNTLNSRATNSFLTRQSDIDVISPDSTWLSQFVNAGWLVKLDDLIHRDKDEIKPQDFIPQVIYSANEWKGGLYTVPVAAYAMDVMYRPDVFDALGIDHPPDQPSDDWTWDRYLDNIKAITGRTVAGTRLFGTVIAGSGPQPVIHMYSQLAASMGVRWFKAFPDAPTWDFAPQLNSPTNLAALQVFEQLYKNSPPASVNYVWFDAGTAFAKGNVGMMYWWTPYNYLVGRSSYMGTQKSAVEGKYKIAPLPVQPGVPQQISIGNYSFGISKYSEKQDQAWQFIKWASSAATQKKMALLPNHQFADFARASLYDDPDLLKVYEYLPTQLASMKQGNGKVARPPIPNYTTIEGDYGQAVNQMLAGGLTARAALDETQKKTEATLETELYIPWERPSYDDTLTATEALLKKLSS